MLGAARVSKSALGIIGFFIVISVALLPFIKAMVILILFSFGNAIIGPFTDKRISNCFSVIHDSAKMLVGILAMFIVLYIIQIAFFLRLKI